MHTYRITCGVLDLLGRFSQNPRFISTLLFFPSCEITIKDIFVNSDATKTENTMHTSESMNVKASSNHISNN